MPPARWWPISRRRLRYICPSEPRFTLRVLDQWRISVLIGYTYQEKVISRQNPAYAYSDLRSTTRSNTWNNRMRRRNVLRRVGHFLGRCDIMLVVPERSESKPQRTFVRSSREKWRRCLVFLQEEKMYCT